MDEPFEWDDQKAEINLRKHAVSFDEAATVFADPNSFTIGDPDHSMDEDRFIINGLSIYGRVLVVVHRFRNGRIRIISARQASRREREQYEHRH